MVNLINREPILLLRYGGILQNRIIDRKTIISRIKRIRLFKRGKIVKLIRVDMSNKIIRVEEVPRPISVWEDVV